MLEELRKPKLVKVAEHFGVDLEEKDTIKIILGKLEDFGVDNDLYEKFKDEIFPEDVEQAERQEVNLNIQQEEPSASDQFEKVVVKLQHANPVFETHGYKFTKENPFVAIPAEKAQLIMESWPDKFHIASPKELREFYK